MSISFSAISYPGEGSELTCGQFAALAESLEATFYAQALQTFCESDFADAGFSNGQVFLDQIE